MGLSWIHSSVPVDEVREEGSVVELHASAQLK